jgi:hypothetical protein
MKINIPLKIHTRGKITLGPKPGTPEYEQEQREKEKARGDSQHGGEERGASGD